MQSFWKHKVAEESLIFIQLTMLKLDKIQRTSFPKSKLTLRQSYTKFF
jgi:hypothetical protein